MEIYYHTLYKVVWCDLAFTLTHILDSADIIDNKFGLRWNH